MSHVVEIRISGCARIQPPAGYNMIESEEQWIGSRKVLVLASALPKNCNDLLNFFESLSPCLQQAHLLNKWYQINHVQGRKKL